MTNEHACNDLNLERTSIQSGWSPEEKEQRRRMAGNKQLQLKQLMFLTAIASQKIRGPKTRPARTRQPAQLTTLMA